jgi:hypothetical protein
VKSIVRSSKSDDDEPFHEQHEPVHNGALVNENNSVLGAVGYDPARLPEVDSDTAFALRLQEEEYARESSIPNRHPYRPFRVETNDDESNAAGPSIHFNADAPQFTTDEEFAVYLQEQEDRQRQQFHRASAPFFSVRQRPNPASSQSSETNETETERVPHFLRFPQRQPSANEDDSDEENPYMNMPHPFLQFFANQGRNLPEDFPPIFPVYRGRGYRRSGNLQDTHEDFGPEDYEVIPIN